MGDQPSTSQEPTQPLDDGSITLRRLLVISIIVRLFIDTSLQIFSPYLAVIAAGLGISIVLLGALNSIRSLMGLTAPGFASLTNKVGYRRVLRLLLLLSSAGMFLFSFSTHPLLLVVSMVIMGLGIFSFAPILQAYISAFIPYRSRARGLGMVEVSWALAGIVGLSISGLLIQRFDWRAPFWFLGTGLLIAFFIFGALPRTQHRVKQNRQRFKIPDIRQLLSQIRELFHFEFNVRSSWGAVLVGALIVFAMVNLGMTYGTWLGQEYGLNPAQIGLVALILGLGDLTAIAFVSTFGDRIGKRRLVLISVSFSVIAYLLLPVLNIYLYAAILGILLTRITFEAGMVSNISVLSEQIPMQRAKVLTVGSAAVTVGVALGNLVGPSAYSRWGIPSIGIISAVTAFIAAFIVFRWVKEGADDPIMEDAVLDEEYSNA